MLIFIHCMPIVIAQTQVFNFSVGLSGDCLPMSGRWCYCCAAVLYWWRCKKLQVLCYCIYTLHMWFVCLKSSWPFHVLCRSERWILLHCKLGLQYWWESIHSGWRNKWNSPCYWCWQWEDTQGLVHETLACTFTWLKKTSCLFNFRVNFCKWS